MQQNRSAMNILFTCSARKWGGNEAWVLHAAHLLKDKHRVFLAYRNPEIGGRFSVPAFRLPFRHEADIRTLAGLAGLIRKHSIDVVVPTKRKDYFLAGLACRLTGAKNVLILGIVRNLKNNAVDRLVYSRLADGIIVNAEVIREVLLQSSFMKPEKIAVVPNSVEIDVQDIRPATGTACFTVTSLAELSERKGVDFLIRGFARFVQHYAVSDARLVIMGEGGEREKLGMLAKNLGIGDQVTFTGFLRNPYPHLLSGDVFALTSKNEGIPYAIIEAALLGNAIIATKAGGIEELLEEGKECFYVGFGDESLFARRLFELYSDAGLRQKLADHARKVASERFSLEQMEQKMIVFLQNIIRGNCRRRH
jgi:glycosyltransferase involved in cell wall biosynthesis